MRGHPLQVSPLLFVNFLTFKCWLVRLPGKKKKRKKKSLALKGLKVQGDKKKSPYDFLMK